MLGSVEKVMGIRMSVQNVMALLEIAVEILQKARIR